MTTSSPPDNNENNLQEKPTQRVNLAGLRQQAGLSLEDMSNRLKLGRDLLRQLEAGETEHLGATAYIKGYLKNYAKILGLPAAELIENYPLPAEKLPRINTQYAIANVAPRRRSSGHFLGYLLGSLIVAAFAYGIWYMMAQNQGRKANGLDVQVGTGGEQNQPADSRGENDFHYSSLLPPPPAGQEATAPESSPATQPENKNSVVPEENGPATDTPASQSDDNDTASQKPNGVSSIGSMPENQTPEQAQASVQIELKEAAWVSLRQVNGERLEHNLLPAGTYRYQARLPLHFRLGNAQKVDVKINGSEIPFRSQISKDVADFDWPLPSQKVATN
jgi:cytoskeleton protein RodZ